MRQHTFSIFRISFLIPFLLLVFGLENANAQRNSNGNLADSVATLYQKYLDFEKNITSTNNLGQNLNKLEQNIQSNTSAIQQVGQQTLDFEKNITKINNLDKSLNKLEKNIKDNASAIQQVSQQTQAIGDIKKQLETTNKSVNVLQKNIDQSKQKSDQSINELSQKMDASNNAINNLQQGIERGNKDNQKAADAIFDRINKQDNNLTAIQQKTETMDKALLQIAGAAEQHDAAISGLSSLSQSLADLNTVNERQENALKELYQKIDDPAEKNTVQSLQSNVENNKNEVLNLRKTYTELNGQVTQFNELLQSNNTTIRQLTDKNLSTQEVQLKRQQNKITSTAEFVKAADISLGTIVLSNALSDYLNDVSALNNPENQELGFSLSGEISKIIDRSVIKGKKVVNDVKADKFLRIVDNVIRSPITKSITSAIPVVSSIKSVINMILGVAIKGKSISVGDITNFKLAIGDYIEHYEGLANANQTFDLKLNNVKVRTDALKLLLKNYTIERANALNPNTIPNKTTEPLSRLVQQYYSPDKVSRQVGNIVKTHNRNGRMNFESALTDKKLGYPNYAINQARFIQDELEAISKEYMIAFEGYQKNIEMVLTRSKKIGNTNKIDTKIRALQRKLGDMAKAYDNAVRIEEVKDKFRKLSLNAL